ncbi:Sulfur carrier protein ThiS adenylyltransferase [Saliniradius amylolyticus]|uniref:Sulfur carrier protein ThiS adenylyltransferase n=1 Tax=Saliniradius amylolyticus TaxID=2183582 RepID=A0A2S2E4Y7_9ALTE|nr:HesA/MoeB/ThiF family protein [Saliniradius amylolyticus]AWL12721.1 Sulfur carrier protein ThiS adenylyltransferase [Saliniradius amylolyticus]
MLSDKERLRYARQMMLQELGEAGQLRLAGTHVLIVGVGGLGCPAAQYLAAAGIGRITLADNDKVELSNLHRQPLYRINHIDAPKVEVAEQQLYALNPEVRVRAVKTRLSGRVLSNYVAEADIVLDCADSLDTSFALNQACQTHKKVFIQASAIGTSGQLISFDFRRLHKPCFECLFPDTGHRPEHNCQTIGVLGPVLGIIGSAQALEAIKASIPGFGIEHGRFRQFEGINMHWQSLMVTPASACPRCQNDKA